MSFRANVEADYEPRFFEAGDVFVVDAPGLLVFDRDVTVTVIRSLKVEEPEPAPCDGGCCQLREPRVFSGETEPDVEVGTKLRDKDGDVLVKLGAGKWGYAHLGGPAWEWQPELEAKDGPYTEVFPCQTS